MKSYKEGNDTFLKFCCLLTGMNYKLMSKCSAQSVNNAKKYTGALLIIMLVWFFIGYSFAERYLKLGVLGSLVGGLLMMFIILQIERIIILSQNISIWGKSFRVLLAVVMAILGAMILDQITFKDDINLRRAEKLDERVNEAVIQSEKDLRQQISDIEPILNKSNLRLVEISEELQERPVIVTNYTTSSVTRDSLGNSVQSTSQRNTAVMENPLKVEFDFLQNQIKELNDKKFSLLNSITDLKKTKEEELKNATGFLQELDLLKEVVWSSGMAMFVYFLFLFFFLALELFILVMKLTDIETDYDKLIQHQVDINIKMLGELKPTK